jgi:hypothetical protein
MHRYFGFNKGRPHLFWTAAAAGAFVKKDRRFSSEILAHRQWKQQMLALMA